MKTAQINQTLVGKRVKGIYTGLAYEGTVIGVAEYRDIYTGQLCSKGLKIELDHPIQWGEDEYNIIESTARVKDDWGNLQYTELIN